MALFRRRTDRIYATLQQVQRRITQGTEPGEGGEQTPSYGGMSSPSQEPAQKPLPTWTPPPRSGTGYVVMPDGQRHATQDDDQISHHSSAPSSAALPEGAQDTGASLYQERSATASLSGPASSGLSGQPTNPSLDLAASEGRGRSVIELSPNTCFMIVIAWIATVVGALFIGWSQAGSDRPNTGVAGPPLTYGSGVAPSAGGPINDPNAETRASAAAAAAIPAGQYVLVLRSSKRATSDNEQEYAELAAKGNAAWAKKNIDPLFGVRRTSSGQIMFVYGKVGSGFGIPKDDNRANDTFTALRQAFPDLYWLSLAQ